MRRTFLAMAILLCWQVAAIAGGTLSIRLVEARTGKPHQGPGLADVAATLKSMRYNQFTLIGQARTSLPATGTASRLGSYTVVCSGKQDSLQILVRSGKRKLLSTTVRLRDGKPVVIGGFPARGAKHVLVFLSR